MKVIGLCYMEDLNGKKFGYLTALYRTEDHIQPSGQHKQMWKCVCDCGKECDIRVSDLKSGNTTSCGCMSSRKRSVGLVDLTGKEFGDYIVIKRAPNKITPSGQQKSVWECKCKKCGIEKNIQAAQLKKFSGKCECTKKLDIFKENLVGQTYGKLTVTKFSRKENYVRYWECTCSCGKTNIIVSEQKLKSGEKISCGCIRENERKQKELEKQNALSERKQKELERKQKDLKTCNISIEKKIESEKVLVKKDEIHTDKKITTRSKAFDVSNSLSVKNPSLAAEWHPDKNGKLTPNEVYYGSTKIVWWKCENGHEWKAAVNSRRNHRCPYCTNRKLWEGYNDLETTNPELLDEWDYEKNDVLPSKVRGSSYQKVWWKCSLGHSYDMSISTRTGSSKSGCPYCSVPAKRVLAGFNDLATIKPAVIEEWDYEKNSLSPNEVLPGSAQKVWWRCSKGHSFQQAINYKASSKLQSTCPYCSHQKLLKGYNDLATTHTYILEEWDYDKNDVDPSDIGVGTHYKAWWRCPFGHSYQAHPYNRCGKARTGCPICDKGNHTSFPEQAILFYVKNLYKDAVNSDRNAIGMELDIYIPSKKIAIEYDGCNWHKDNKYEIKKNILCKENGITLIRIRESGLKKYEDCICFVRENNRSDDSLSSIISILLKHISENIDEYDVDVRKDAPLIYASYIRTRKEKNLLVQFPKIASEWNYNKNNNLTPEMVAPYTSKKVWWIGECGHEYQMKIEARTNSTSSGCPFCSGKRVLAGFNDLATKYPNLLNEWDYEKNEGYLLPSEVAAHSDKKAWWRCNNCGNSWKAKIDSRTRMQAGCPACGREALNISRFKAVINIDTGETFESIKEASEKYGISRACIGNVCKGKQKKAGKYHWKYAELK